MGGEETSAQKAAEAAGGRHLTPVQRIGAKVQQEINSGSARATGRDSAGDEQMDGDDDGGSDEFGSEE